jgi:hypothetical protein
MLMLTALIISTLLNIVPVYMFYRSILYSDKLENDLFMAKLQRDLELFRDLDTPVPSPDQIH